MISYIITYFYGSQAKVGHDELFEGPLTVPNVYLAKVQMKQVR